MAIFDHSTGKLVVHILYCGPQGAGTSTHLRQLCGLFSALRRGELLAFDDTDGDEPLFEWLRLEGGTLAGHSVRCHLIAAPARPDRAEQRAALLRHTDVIVFVCPNDAARLGEARLLLDQIDEARLGAGLGKPPLVINVNHCDRAEALPAQQFAEHVARDRPYTFSSGQANVGSGVRETVALAMRLGVEEIRAYIQRDGIEPLQGRAMTGDDLRALVLPFATSHEASTPHDAPAPSGTPSLPDAPAPSGTPSLPDAPAPSDTPSRPEASAAPPVVQPPLEPAPTAAPAPPPPSGGTAPTQRPTAPASSDPAPSSGSPLSSDVEVTFEFRDLSSWLPPENDDLGEVAGFARQAPEPSAPSAPGASLDALLEDRPRPNDLPSTTATDHSGSGVTVASQQPTPPLLAPAPGVPASGTDPDIDALWDFDIDALLEQAERALIVRGSPAAPVDADKPSPPNDAPQKAAREASGASPPRTSAAPPFTRHLPPRPASHKPGRTMNTPHPAAIAGQAQPPPASEAQTPAPTQTQPPTTPPTAPRTIPPLAHSLGSPLLGSASPPDGASRSTPPKPTKLDARDPMRPALVPASGEARDALSSGPTSAAALRTQAEVGSIWSRIFGRKK